MAMLKILRGVAILLPQAVILLIAGGRFDLLFGFNRTDAGFGTLLFLLALAPPIGLMWFLVETVMAIGHAKRNNRAVSLLMPAIAFFFFLESLCAAVYMVLQFRM